MPHSQPLDEYVSAQLHKILKFLESEKDPRVIEVVLEAHHIHAHDRAEIHIKTPEYHVIATCEEPGVRMYEAIDRVLDHGYRQLREQKERKIGRQRSGKQDNYKGA